MRRKLKAWVFALVRPLFVRRVDPNEDFVCGLCGEPVLRRYIYCSQRCSDADDALS